MTTKETLKRIALRCEAQQAWRLALQRIWWNNVEMAPKEYHRRYQFYPLSMFDFLEALYGVQQ